ncbi:ribose-5-phosphate isomerase RpiA [Peribacillus butanolivorans]|uniref:Ribose-5-phosphate isomerase A n=1 Tax=Peribacillus butanolivorans TaxID=421767 RepID=A0ABN5NBW7_9BACI|nr:ribose-5-phosphate isomerase RpiA [Peribacillus butanolivorans]AXN41040.1 ribose-5-phosphate isomerase RpiA [Peribacillus butanolivorans]
MVNDYEKEKVLAAQEAVKYIEDGMVVGVGSGTTIVYFIKYLGERVKNGLNVIAVPTSDETADLCKNEGITLVTTSVPIKIDVTVDGADQFDMKLRLIKGGGGALLREKIVASATKREIIIVDSRKKVDVLGEAFALPVEVIPLAWFKVAQEIKKLNGNPVLRLKSDSSYFITDQGNYILDCKFDSIPEPEELATKLSSITGLVEHGLFINLAREVIMGKEGNVYYFKHEFNISKVITERMQVDTIDEIFVKIDQVVKSGGKPVVEMDVDLTTFKPINRTIKALELAGETYRISEFLEPLSKFDLLPGYTPEAWTNFLSRNKLPEKYPELKWVGIKDGTGSNASVYSAFHIAFWSTEWLTEDILTEGLIEFVSEIEKRGGIPVFISGRWKDEQFEPTREVLVRGGIKDPILVIGKPHHNGKELSDAENKAMRQKEIREKYGTPIVFIDDRLENRVAVCKENPDSDILSVGISIPGFTYDEEITGVSIKVSSFEFKK